MDIKQIMSFIKIEHTLFSLPFIIIGFFIAVEQFYPSGEMPLADLFWVLVAAVGAPTGVEAPGWPIPLL